MYHVDVPVHASGFCVWPLFHQNKIVPAFFDPHAVKKNKKKVFPIKGSILGPMLFKILVKYLDYRTLCLLKKTVAIIRLRGKADTLQRQSTLETLQWAGRLE